MPNLVALPCAEEDHWTPVVLRYVPVEAASGPAPTIQGIRGEKTRAPDQPAEIPFETVSRHKSVAAVLGARVRR